MTEELDIQFTDQEFLQGIYDRLLRITDKLRKLDSSKLSVAYELDDLLEDIAIIIQLKDNGTLS